MRQVVALLWAKLLLKTGEQLVMHETNPNHLKLRNIPEFSGEVSNRENDYVEEKTWLEALNINNFLWIFSSWSIVGLNLFIAILLIRDMVNETYQPANHYFMTAAFTFTVGVLAIVQNYVINKKK